jgi:hypothetical protein
LLDYADRYRNLRWCAVPALHVDEQRVPAWTLCGTMAR